MSQADDYLSERLDPLERADEEDHLNGPISSPDFVVPVLSEELKIEKFLTDKATVRLTKIVHEHPETISAQLASGHVEVVRVSKDEIIDSAPSIRMEGDVMVIPVIEEILVVTKRLRLKEELRVHKKQIVNEYRQDVTLRSQEITVERQDH